MEKRSDSKHLFLYLSSHFRYCSTSLPLLDTELFKDCPITVTNFFPPHLAGTHTLSLLPHSTETAHIKTPEDLQLTMPWASLRCHLVRPISSILWWRRSPTLLTHSWFGHTIPLGLLWPNCHSSQTLNTGVYQSSGHRPFHYHSTLTSASLKD